MLHAPSIASRSTTCRIGGEENFRAFTFADVVRLHGGMNPGFFEGIIVEAEVRSRLGP